MNKRIKNQTEARVVSAVFLDRDGTLTVDRGYTHRVEDLQLHPNVVEGLLLLQKQGFLLFVVSNQSGIGRGLFTEDQYQAFTNALTAELAHQGVVLTKAYHCPHRPDEGCGCRKPGVLHYRNALQRFRLAAETSYVIGDKTQDIEAGKRIGAKTILVGTGHAGGDQEYPVKPDYTASDLLAAAQWILRHAMPDDS